MTSRERVVGVIGGMGPLATVEFMRRLVAAVPAHDDGDHLHVIVDNNPKVPSRIAALIEKTGEDPAPVLVRMARGLEVAGADFLAVPCNTAHAYLPAIQAAIGIPVIDVVELSIAALASLSPRPRRVGIVASPAVRLVGLFEKPFAAAGFAAVFPDPAAEQRLLEVIRAIKSCAVEPAQRTLYDSIAARLVETDIEALVVACTELSLLARPRVGVPVVDTLDLLVEESVRLARPSASSGRT